MICVRQSGPTHNDIYIGSCRCLIKLIKSHITHLGPSYYFMKSGTRTCKGLIPTGDQSKI